jgi:V/A-type H+-transporting ATPase subunit D
MELIQLTKKIKLAKKGHRLLKEKRDALIMEFLEIIKSGSQLRKTVEEQLALSFKNLIRANALAGSLDVKSAAMATKPSADVGIESRNVIGVKVPKLSQGEGQRNISNRGYSPINTSLTIDEAARDFEKSLKMVLELAEVEKSIKLLATEVEKTKRRVNALEYVMIPRLQNASSFIEMRLDEMEREDFSRLKKIKTKLEK